MLLAVSANAQQGVYGVNSDYEDTEFGELLYNEASVPTRLEILNLLSKDTPSMLVFMHAVSMGLGIDDVLDAAVRYEPNKARDFTESAISLLPLLSESTEYLYSTYELDDIDRDDATKAYSVAYIAERFFEDRSILVPYADWLDGQSHFEASAVELLELSKTSSDIRWYRNKSINTDVNRPIFVSLYEADGQILVDSVDRIKTAVEQNGDRARLPVVIIYNRVNERPIDHLGYPMTLTGVQKAYAENLIMATPAPEWERGEYHIIAQFEEIYEIFDIPEEDDFEPEHWQRLLANAEKYNGTDPAFLVVVLASGEDGDLAESIKPYTGQQFAANRDPRDGESLPYKSRDDNPIDLKSLMAKGLIINRPDMVAALNALGVSQVPVAFYYIDSARTKPFVRGPRVLRAIGEGIESPGNPGGQGGFGPPPEDPPEDPPEVASPPRNN